MKIETGLILCAGFGKRVAPLTDKTPKPLLKIKNNVLLDNSINFLEKFAPEVIFSQKFGEVISQLHKEELLKRVCRLCNQTPNGNLGLDIRPIHNTEKLLGYCTKQINSLDNANVYFLIHCLPTSLIFEYFIKS